MHIRLAYYEHNMLQGQFINTYFDLSTAFVLGKNAIFNFFHESKQGSGVDVQYRLLLIKSLTEFLMKKKCK